MGSSHGDPDDHRGDRVIAGVSATWLVDEGQPGERTPPATIFMAFTVHEGRITTIQRLYSLEETVQDQARPGI